MDGRTSLVESGKALSEGRAPPTPATAQLRYRSLERDSASPGRSQAGRGHSASAVDGVAGRGKSADTV